MKTLVVKKPQKVSGTIHPPGDKSMTHRAIIFSSIAEGQSRIENFLPAEDCLRTVEIMKSLGVPIHKNSETSYTVDGVGMHGLKAPEKELYCGNSGTTMRLVSGLLAGQNFTSYLTGDESLSKRPMDRIIKPLTMMRAWATGYGKKGTAPLTISGGRLRAIDYEIPVASAQVKTCVLIAGLYADGVTSVTEPHKSRDHTERMLKDFGVEVVVEGNKVAVKGDQKLRATDIVIPGDISSASYFIVLAAIFPDAELTIKNVGLNPTRSAILNILERMGASISVDTAPYAGEKSSEPKGDVTVRASRLRGTTIEGDEIPKALDEIPILSVAGACAEGQTVIKDAKELRVKETDRIHAMTVGLRKMGVNVDEKEDGMIIEGAEKLHAAEIDSFGDHRIAMSFAIAGLLADGTTTIRDTECIRTSFPDFEKILHNF